MPSAHAERHPCNVGVEHRDYGYPGGLPDSLSDFLGLPGIRPLVNIRMTSLLISCVIKATRIYSWTTHVLLIYEGTIVSGLQHGGNISRSKNTLISPLHIRLVRLKEHTTPYTCLPRPRADDPAIGPGLPSKRVVPHADALKRRLSASGGHHLFMLLKFSRDVCHLCSGIVVGERR